MEILRRMMLDYEFLIIFTILVGILIILIRATICSYENNKKEKYPQEAIGVEFEKQFEKIAGKKIEKISKIRTVYILALIVLCIIGVIAYIEIESKTKLVEGLLFLYPVLIVIILGSLYKKQGDKLIIIKGKIIEQVFENIKMIDMFNFSEHYKEADFDVEHNGYKINVHNGLIAFWGKIKNKYDYLYADISVYNEYTLLKTLVRRKSWERLFDSKLFDFDGGFIKIAYDRCVEPEEINLPYLINRYSKFCNMNISLGRKYIYIRVSELDQHAFKNQLKNEIYRECLQIKILISIAEDIIEVLE